MQKSPRHLAALKDVRLQVNAASRVADGLELRLIELFAVAQHRDGAAMVHLRVGQRLQRLEKTLVVQRRSLKGFDLIFERGRKQRHQQ
jgi:hypothetical protein